MNPLFSIGKLMVIAGIFLLILGLLLMFSGKLFNIGRLPGDIFVQRGNFTLYFPIATTIILSIILTILLNVFFRR